MRKLWLALIVMAVFASAAAFASPANYLSILGGGIIAEQEQLNPFNPAGIQFTNNFVQLEVYNKIAGADPIAVDPTGSPNVMFVFPMVASLKFNDLFAFRLGIFDPAETAMIPSVHGNVRMGGNSLAVAVVSPIAVTWAMKLANLGFGVKYELNVASQGKWTFDNFNLSYSKHKLEPGILFNLGAASISVIGDLDFVFLGWGVASTNTTGTFITNTVTAKSPLEMAMVRGQISYPLFGKLLLSGRVEAGLKMFGYDEKYANTIVAGTLTNDNNASAYNVKIMAGLKYSPLAIIDAYFDIGTKMYGHNVINNQVGSGAFANATNTNVINQVTVPSIALGIAFKPGIFTFSLGLSQDIVASSSPIAITPATISSAYELDGSGAAYSLYGGNTVWDMLRKASMGVSMNLNPFILEAVFDISTTSFLGREINNPFDMFSRIFNSAYGPGVLPTMFTGLRCSVLF